MVEVTLTVGKLDASIAVLLTSDHHLIEFPSILLPSDIQAGSIVKINCMEDSEAQKQQQAAFEKLQEDIYSTYGSRSPSKPVLRLRNATQTSVVLEWDPIDLAMADLRSLILYRNSSRLGKIPSPTTNTSTKLSGLSVDSAYTFHLELATSAGTYVSDKLTVKTQKMTDLSGITVCLGHLSDDERALIEQIVQRIGAKPIQDRVRIDTTHFICVEGRGAQWERAVDSNIPVVRPEWLSACESEGRIVGVRSYYLNADPSSRPPLTQIQRDRIAPSPKKASGPQPEASKLSTLQTQAETGSSSETEVKTKSEESVEEFDISSGQVQQTESLDTTEQLPVHIQEEEEEESEDPTTPETAPEAPTITTEESPVSEQEDQEEQEEQEKK
ncbi:hypothetical protein V1511DRAFT_446597, partial [Dipodascopsis uninucleata]